MEVLEQQQAMVSLLSPALSNSEAITKEQKGSRRHPPSLLEVRSGTIAAWLLSVYEINAEGSTPRQELYEHYQRACEEGAAGGMPTINAATLGKIVRAAFPGVGTRRLGTRGRSRYHYLGISPKNLQIDDLMQQTANRTVKSHRKPCKRKAMGLDALLRHLPGASNQPQAQVVHLEPDYTQFDSLLRQLCPGPQMFYEQYALHLLETLKLICKHAWHPFEAATEAFWRMHAEDIILMEDASSRFIRIADEHWYQTALVCLTGSVFDALPVSLNQAIRHFARQYEHQVSCLMSAMPYRQLAMTRMQSAARFCQSLRRRTALNHLSQAVSGVLGSSELRSALLRDWNHIDMTGVRMQLQAWGVELRESILSYLETSVRALLTDRSTDLLSWARWTETVTEQCLRSDIAVSALENFEDAQKSLLCKASMLGSLLVRDLTLRSASSFGKVKFLLGSFHLIKLWLEEYMYFYLEGKMEEYLRILSSRSI